MEARYDPCQYNQIQPPIKCPGDGQEKCFSTKFDAVEMTLEQVQKSCRDYQEVKVQEQITALSIGTVPRSIAVILEDDLVDSCKPGDDLWICGRVIQRWKKGYEGERCAIELSLMANNIVLAKTPVYTSVLTEANKVKFTEFWDKHRSSPIVGRDIILGRFCPQVFGMYLVKLAVILVLIGGIEQESEGHRTRGDSHLLIVGDPGTAKVYSP